MRRLKDKEEKFETKVIPKTLLFAAFVNSLYQEATSKKSLARTR